MSALILARLPWLRLPTGLEARRIAVTLLVLLAGLGAFNYLSSGSPTESQLGASLRLACFQVGDLLLALLALLVLGVLVSRFTRLRYGRSLVLMVPYLWMALFFLLPFAIVLKISFAESAVAIPPYTDLFSHAEQKLQLLLNLGNYLNLQDNSIYLRAYLGSLKMAFFCTLICLLIGYPMAYAIARATPQRQMVLLLLIMMPTWTAILIRVYAWMSILGNGESGLLNSFLLWIGLIDEPLRLLNTQLAVYIGVVYSYLPFMILPLYANLVKHDRSLLEAASDLGARSFASFWKVTVPLSRNGVIAGCMLVFIPVIGEFVIPELLGGSQSLMIGRVLWEEFFSRRNWPGAAALAVVMLAILIIPIILFNRSQAREMEGKA